MYFFHIVSLLAVAAYGIASVGSAIFKSPKTFSGRAAWIELSAFALGVVCSAMILISVFISSHSPPLMGFALSTLIGGFSLYFAINRKIPILLTFSAPLCFLILLVQIFFLPHYPKISNEQHSLISLVHIYSAIIGQVCAVLAALVGFLLVMQHRNLKHKDVSHLEITVSSLDHLKRLLLVLLWIGFVFISITLITGAYVAMMGSTERVMQVSAKVLWALCVWCWYLFILVGHNLFSFSYQRIARLSLIGFILLVTSYFGVVFVRPFGSM